ncbi:MAG: hypothetical protein IKF47_00305 [Bacilli bacterium]|nr:hypothetical protein [Bacilli bacterium]
MNKKLLGIIGTSLIIVLLIISFIIPNKDKTPEQITMEIVSKATNESQKIKPEEQKEFIEINIDDYLNKYNENEKSIVFVGRLISQDYQIVAPILHNLAYKYNLDIYYLNSDNFTTEDKTKFVESDTFFTEGFGSALFTIIGNGKLHDIVDGITDTEHYIKFLKRNGYIS